MRGAGCPPPGSAPKISCNRRRQLKFRGQKKDVGEQTLVVWRVIDGEKERTGGENFLSLWRGAQKPVVLHSHKSNMDRKNFLPLRFRKCCCFTSTGRATNNKQNVLSKGKNCTKVPRTNEHVQVCSSAYLNRFCSDVRTSQMDSDGTGRKARTTMRSDEIATRSCVHWSGVYFGTN